MKRGFSRYAFNQTKRYVGVVLQQGKVIVDSDWNKVDETDVGITLLKMFINLADQLSYYQDRVADEAFLSKASRRLKVSKSVLCSVLHTAQAVNAITPYIAVRQRKTRKTRAHRQ